MSLDYNRPALSLATLVFAASLLVFTLSANLRVLLSSGYLALQYSRLKTEAAVNGGLKSEAAPIIDYLKNKTDKLNGLTPKEQAHMADVRRLFNASLYLSFLAPIILMTAGFFIKRQSGGYELWRFVGLAAAGDLAVLLAFVGGIYINFGWVFDHFHRLFFAGNSWLFDSDSVLLRLFPFNFWSAAARDWALLTATELGLVALASVAAMAKRGRVTD